MKKQIIYPKFIPRLFAMTIDLLILSAILTPLMYLISNYVFLYFFNDFFVTHGIKSWNKETFFMIIQMPEFVSYFTPSKIFSYLAISLFLHIVNIIFMGAYFVIFWRKFGATPGKMFMQMKIVDATTLARPSTGKLIKRFLSYITALIGMWSIIFGKRKMALHDKIANTVVIKS